MKFIFKAVVVIALVFTTVLGFKVFNKTKAKLGK